jgi:tetratricopeptide (TPR) repeat protein
VRAGRYEQAIDAYRHLIAADPDNPLGHLGMARALLTLRRLDDARHHAETAADLSQPVDRASVVESQELLMRIAFARGDRTAARAHAESAQEADPGEPWLAFAEARFLYDDGQYAEALAGFEAALASVEQGASEPMMADLHYYIAESLGQLERWSEAEHHFVEELRVFPSNSRARAGLALSYYRAGRMDEAADALADMLRIIPTPESYGLAARFWTSLGETDRAAAVRAEARRTFGNRAAASASVRPAADH